MEHNDGAPIRLMLLDDNERARGRSVTRLQQDAGLQVVAETSASAEAVSLATQLHPDAVLVETRRLDKHGLEAISLLSSLEEETRPAIVAYLETIHRGDWPHARAAGADDVVLKEMPVRSLARELRKIVNRVHGDPRAIGSTQR